MTKKNKSISVKGLPKGFLAGLNKQSKTAIKKAMAQALDNIGQLQLIALDNEAQGMEAGKCNCPACMLKKSLIWGGSNSSDMEQKMNEVMPAMRQRLEPVGIKFLLRHL